MNQPLSKPVVIEHELLTLIKELVSTRDLASSDRKLDILSILLSVGINSSRDGLQTQVIFRALRNECSQETLRMDLRRLVSSGFLEQKPVQTKQGDNSRKGYLFFTSEKFIKLIKSNQEVIRLLEATDVSRLYAAENSVLSDGSICFSGYLIPKGQVEVLFAIYRLGGKASVNEIESAPFYEKHRATALVQLTRVSKRCKNVVNCFYDDRSCWELSDELYAFFREKEVKILEIAEMRSSTYFR